MSLRTKVFLIFAPSVALVMVGLFALLDTQMMKGYEQIESDYIREHVSRAVDTFERQAVTELCRGDWSYWDDVYQFVEDRNPEFVETNISSQSFADIDADTIVFVNVSGEVVFARSYDPDTQEEMPVPPELLKEIKPGSYFLNHTEPLTASSIWGLLATSNGVVSVGSKPILKSSYEGPTRGTLIFARRIRKEKLDVLGKQLHLLCNSYALNGSAPPGISEIAARILRFDSNTAEQTEVVRQSEVQISGYTFLRDIRHQAILLLEVSTPRHIYQQARIVHRNLEISFFGIGAAMLVGLLILLELLIVARLRRFSSRVREICQSGDHEARIVLRGKDEVAGLANDVNTLMAALSESIQRDAAKDRRYRMLTTHAAVGMYESAPNGECLFVNACWCEISGMSAERAAGTGWYDVIHPDDREWVLALSAEHIPKGEPFEFECRFERPDGDVRSVFVNVAPLRNEDGAVSGCIGSVMDISDIRRAEHEIRENEKRYRGIIEMQAEFVCRYRPDTILTYVNDAYCVYFGRKREDLIGKSFLEVLPSDSSLEEILTDLRNSSGPSTTRHKFNSELEGERWQEWVDTPVRDADGHIIEFQAVGGDITERKLAEDALRENEAKLRSITSSVADAIMMMDEEALVTFWNESAERIFGYSRMEILGRPLHDMIVPERYRAAFSRGHGHFLETGKGAVVGRSQEIQGLRKDGAEFPIELTVAPVPFSGAWHAIGTARDITERKRTEEQLEQNARALVAANAQLEEAIGQANQLALEAQVASMAKGDFVANMSHEIRTPLNGVIGMTTLLLDTELTREQREFAEMVRTSGEALLGVVNDILDFSKIEAGKMELETISFDLRAAVEQIGDILAPRAQEKGLQFAILIHHDVPEFVKGDPGRFRQILLNLAGNALKFTERGEIVVSAQVPSGAAGTGAVMFEVSDTGIGIPEDRIKFLFQPFTQADSSTTRKYGGTGLGLTISKRLCEAMGGQIDVRSVVGQGSTFYFTANFEIAPTPEHAMPVDLSSLAGMRLLVVDASATDRRVYRELLRNWGVSVSEAIGGEAAYDAMRAAASNAKPFGVVLVDHVQPKFDAAVFAGQIKGDPVLAATRLLLATSWPKRGDAAAMAQHGFEAYLTKPIKRDHLLEAIAAVTTRRAVKPGTTAALVTQHTINEAARGRTRILLVEDNIINQKVSTRVLDQLGYRCDIANNGREAVEAASKTEYNLILMDCQMPVMDGFEATRAIRQLEGDRRHTPIIALTASALRSDHDRCFDAGMDGALTKPIVTNLLQKTLDEFLSDNPPVRGGRAEKLEVIHTSATLTETPVDLGRLEEITMGDPDLETELIVTFLADTAQRISDIAELLATGDAGSVGRMAHALKGSAGTMSANSLHDLAHRLEEMCKSGSTGEAHPVYESLMAEAERVKEYLSGYMHA